MSHLRNVKIKFANVTEMKAIRAVLTEFGYPIFAPFKAATDVGTYNCVHIENVKTLDAVGRGCVHSAYEEAEVLTLEQFIARQAIPTETPAQKELAKLEASAEALNKQIAALKATI